MEVELLQEIASNTEKLVALVLIAFLTWCAATIFSRGSR